MKLPLHKTKIVCTIGPACRRADVLERMMKNGMNVARLNFSHGAFEQQAKDIKLIRDVATKLGRIPSMIIDLPGTKMRVGTLKKPLLMLKIGQKVTLTTDPATDDDSIIPIEYKHLAESVKKGGTILLNDGFIQLKVEQILGKDVLCRVVIGGKLLSHKGINFPGAKLYVDVITKRDFECIEFGLSQGVDTFGLSFVEKASDVIRVREFAKKRGKTVNLIAKIERREAINNFDEILRVVDGVMVARGDLGVEIPLEEVPIIQKMLIAKANALGRPVITATQMLESMTQNIRPTRAEVNDVANAILDGTDAVMLSEETAIGGFPAETVAMMGSIAIHTEEQREKGHVSNDEGKQIRESVRQGSVTVTDVISLNVVQAADKLNTDFIFTPTSSGSTARRISRFKPLCWILAFSLNEATCSFLTFSYGVYPFLMKNKHLHKPEALLGLAKEAGLLKKNQVIVITERRLSQIPGDTDSLAIARV